MAFLPNLSVRFQIPIQSFDGGPKMREAILKELSINNVMKHTEYLADQLPDRYSGNVNDRKAAAYLEENLRSEGIEVSLHEFFGWVSLPLDSDLRILTPEVFDIQSIPFMNIPNTPPEGIEAELADVGPGSEEDLAGKDVRGKVIMAESSYSPPRQEKIRLATEKGAVGALIAHWGLEEPALMVRGNAKAVWGNPTPETMEKMPKIPVLGITKKDLNRLRRLVSRSPVKVRLSGQVDCGWKRLLLPVGRIIGGGDDAEEFIILGGHYDAYGNGATDNANGNGLILEVARVLHKYRNRLNRSLWICFWSGHETGTMPASTWLVDNFWDELRDRCLAYFNVDSPGMTGTGRYSLYVSPELRVFAAGIARDVLAEEPDCHILQHTGDQSFFGIGIPAISSRTMFSPEEIKKMANATLGWWNHGYPCHDTMDKVDLEMMKKNMRAVAATAYEICSKPVLPMDFTPTADEMKERLDRLNQEIGTLLKLSPLVEAARRFRSRVELLESVRRDLARQMASDGQPEPGIREKAGQINRLLIRLSRIVTPAFCSVAGRYGQDPYGLSHLKTRFPGFYYAPRLTGLDKSGDAYNLLFTECMRQRNRVADILSESIRHVDRLL